MYYTWKTILSYKARLYDKTVNLVNPINTSQICSTCGTKLKTKLILNERIFKCNKCNLEINRDYNSALNILKLGLNSI